MRDARAVTDRFLDVVRRHLTPALAQLGFEPRRAALAREGDGVRHLVEVELAPWTTPDKIVFTISWGVAVPGLDEVLGDATGTPARVDVCPVRARLGVGDGHLDPRWFTVGPAPARVLAPVLDARTGAALGAAAVHEVVPALDWFDSIQSVQAHLVVGLKRGRGAPGGDELQRIRWIAGLSLLLGERENASRWLDYLEVRSSSTIAPDVVAERLAGLRLRCAS